MTFEIHTNPAEFLKFHYLLIKNAPEDYEPFYFALVPNSKDPIKSGKYDPILAGSWLKRKLTVNEAYILLEKGYNIAIAALSNEQLCIVDVDDIGLVGSIKPTLIAQSRKRIGRHNFFFTSDESTYEKENPVFIDSAKDNIDTDIAGEVRANNQYVVCVGSFVECSEEEILKIPEEDRVNAGKYSIFAENDVSYITYEELPDIYKQKHEQEKLSEIEYQIGKEKPSTNENEENSKYKSKLWTLTIPELTKLKNNPTKRFPMFSDFHNDDSKTGGNASISGDLLHCWRHHVSHNAFTFLAVKAGLYTCNDAGRKFKGHRFGATKTPENVYKVWLYAKQNWIIPDSDPAPSKALEYAAISLFNMCLKSDLIDGWKLPTEIYNKTLNQMKASGINTGREPLEKKEKVLSNVFLDDATKELTEAEIYLLKTNFSQRRLECKLPENHFITQFLTYANRMTDGYQDYKILGAFWLLSSLTQRKPFIDLATSSDGIFLNTWAQFLGLSSLSRKTTVIDIIRHLYAYSQGEPLTDTDYSLEGYLETLAQTPVLAMINDEVSTVFQKMNQKYNAGYNEFECKLYDCNSQNKRLASGGKKEPKIYPVKNPYITKLYGTTFVKYKRSMSIPDFDSGFGFRFLYAAPTYEFEQRPPRLRTAEDIEERGKMEVRTAQLYHFFEQAPTFSMSVSQDAFDYYVKVDFETQNEIRHKPNQELLGQAWSRYSIYILKLAALIEIGKMPVSKIITLESVTLAISMILNYFLPTLCDVYNLLTVDPQNNKIDKIIEALKEFKGVTSHSVLLRKTRLESKEFRSLIETTVESGQVEKIIEKNPKNGKVTTYYHYIDCDEVLFENPSYPNTQVLQVPKFTYTKNSMGISENLDLFRKLEGMCLDTPTAQCKIIQTHADSRSKNDVCEPGNLENLGISVNLDSGTEIEEVERETKEIQTVTSSVVSEEEGFRILKEEGF